MGRLNRRRQAAGAAPIHTRDEATLSWPEDSLFRRGRLVAPRTSGIGVVALILTIGTILLFHVLTHLAPQWTSSLIVDLSAPGVSAAEWIEAACMAAALVAGVLAIFMRSGRAEGAAAIVLALVGTSFASRALIALLSAGPVAIDVH